MKRNKDESFEDYKVRRSAQNADFIQRANGKVIWNPNSQGSYIKAKHGPIGDQRGG